MIYSIFAFEKKNSKEEVFYFDLFIFHIAAPIALEKCNRGLHKQVTNRVPRLNESGCQKSLNPQKERDRGDN